MSSFPKCRHASKGDEQPTRSPIRPTEPCGICLEAGLDHQLRLACGHVFCAPCIERAGEYGHRRCPVCRVPHLLDLKALRHQKSSFRDQYRRWRRGSARGVNADISDVSGYAGWRMECLLPRCPSDQHHSVAGLLYASDGAMGEAYARQCPAESARASHATREGVDRKGEESSTIRIHCHNKSGDSSIFSAGMTMMDAAFTLLTLQWVAELGTWFALGQEVEFSRVGRKCDSENLPPPSPCFTSHVRYALKDNIKGEAGTSWVHRFRLNAALASRLGAQLGSDAHSMADSQRGVRISNVGGFHSPEEQLRGEAGMWYSGLYPVLSKAVRAACTPAELDASGCWAMSGWVNVSGEEHFNALHDHGDYTYSLVYFVCDGAAEQRVPSTDDGPPPESPHPATRSEAQGELSGGELLLKCQLRPFSHEYGYFPIRARPGDLWLFPAYMPHAVLPRRLTRLSSGTTPLPPRISVAVNCSIPG